MNNQEIFNSLNEEFKSPIGPVKEQTEVTFNLKFNKTDKIDNARLVIFPIDNWEKRKEIDFKLSDIAMDKNIFTCKYTPDEPAVYYYFFKVNINNEYKELRRGTMGNAIFAGEENECFQLTSFTKEISVPDFMKGGIFYQIFPDRFYNSGKTKDNVFLDRIIHYNWYENPIYIPDEHGEIKNNDFFGGDLRGIIDKLDYIKSLGTTIIYLNPIFESHSNHRYDTANYMKIDPLLGKEEDFEKLCKEAEKRGIKIIIDGVFNHTGSDSIYFNKNNRYNTLGAYNSTESPYYNWYEFYNHPNEYESWWGFKTLPKLNQDNKESLDYIKTVIKYWIDKGASGVRFDVVDELNNERFEEISKTVKSKNATVIGEVWEDVSNKGTHERKRYFTHNSLDSAMNYVFKDALFEFFENKNAEEFLDKILRVIDNYPKDNLDAMMNLISGHDIERALTRLIKGKATGDRYSQASNDPIDPIQYKRGVKLLKMLTMMQYTLPGNPCLYYGDEAGVYGFKDPFNRKTYPWGREDTRLIEFHQTLGQLRNSEKILKDANFKPVIYTKEGLCIFARESLDKKESLYTGVNLSNTTYDLSFLNAEVILSTEENNTILPPNKALILKKRTD